MVFHTYELHKRLEGTGVTVNAFHPGHILTKMTTDSIPKIFIKLIRNYISPEEAAKALVYLAIDDEVANISGKYFQKFTMSESSKESYNVELQQQLWNKSLEMIQEKINGFQSKLE